MKQSLVINLFGGPGIGKSTTTAAIFALLKLHDIDCEMVREFAKEVVWSKQLNLLEDQKYILEEQYKRVKVLDGQVDIIISDSPLVNSIIYNKSLPEEFNTLALQKFNEFNNFNYFLTRKKKYNPNGRTQNEEKAKQIDEEVKSLLTDYSIDYYITPGDINGINTIIYHILLMRGKTPDYHIGSI